jgi:hypothetical protein
LEREPMVDNMPRTELVLALYMAKQIVPGNQDFIASSYAKERCVLPIGLFEQVCRVLDFSGRFRFAENNNSWLGHWWCEPKQA